MKKLILSLLFLLNIVVVTAQETDSIIDIRDGQIYKVVKIGQQWWMQENLNIGQFVESIYTGSSHSNVSDNGIIEKYCYDNEADNCAIYGGLYDWDEMMDYNPSNNENLGITRGICPFGWHLPTYNELTELMDFLGEESIAGGKLKEIGTNHWSSPNIGATNESGFTALPSGQRSKEGLFCYIGLYAYFWSSTEGNSYSAHCGALSYNEPGVDRPTFDKESGFSVRCLRDYYQFGYITILNKNLWSISKLYFTDERSIDTIIIINSSAGKTINISSIYIKNSVYSLDKFSAVLTPGDSIHLTITFNPPSKGIYLDTLFIESDDPSNPVVTIPLKGTYYTEVPCGVITQNTTWTKAESPYYLGCNVAIDHGATLTLEPGTVVLADSMIKITVDGYLVANGTVSDTIVFTNFSNDRFDQIYVRSGGDCEFSYFKIEEASLAVNIENDSLTLINGFIKNCENGLNIPGYTYIKLENVKLSSNTKQGVGVFANTNSKGLIKDCTIEGYNAGINCNGCNLDIISNTIRFNKWLGISMDQGSVCHIENNNIIENDSSISLSGNTTFIYNKVLDNHSDGVNCYECNCTIQSNYIANNTGNGIWTWDQNIIIEGNQITNNGKNGIYNPFGGTPTISRNEISNNSGDGIQTSGVPTINNNNIYINGNYSVHAIKQSGEIINAENNYWGTSEVSEIESSIYDYYDDGVSVKVDFDPFLTGKVEISHLDFANNDTACLGESVPSLSASGDSIIWYSDPDYTTLLHTGHTYNTGESEVGIYTYYVTQTLNDTTILKDTVSLIISTVPVISLVEKTYETTCNSNDGTITINSNDEHPLFYSVDGGKNYFENSGIFTGLSNGNYPVYVKNSNGCEISGGIVEIISEGVIPATPVAGKDTTYCSGDEINDIYAVATSGGTLTWYTDPGLSNIIGTGASYSPSGLTETTSFYVTETYNNCESPSTTVTIKINNDPPYEDEELCMITIDMTTGKNLLIWQKTPYERIASYNLYRETSVIDQYELIGKIQYNQLSVYLDTTAKPEERQYLYKIAVVDSCGNESEKSPYHKPLFLQYVGSTGGVNLQWSDYKIEGGDISFVTYEIYRGENPSSLEKITEVSASLDRYTDTYSEALTKKFYYRIAGVKAEPCYPFGNLKGVPFDYSRSVSNLEDNQLVTVQDYKSENQLNIYPNPFDETTVITYNNPERYRYIISIRDQTGKVVKTIDNITDEKIEISRDGLPAGLYLIELRGPEVYRGKVVIE